MIFEKGDEKFGVINQISAHISFDFINEWFSDVYWFYNGDFVSMNYEFS